MFYYPYTRVKFQTVIILLYSVLQGISGPCEIGFLSYMETLRYIKVGDKLKRPNYPLWVVGSESHFSVVFTLEGRTCAPPSRRKHAEDVFEKHAEEG